MTTQSGGKMPVMGFPIVHRESIPGYVEPTSLPTVDVNQINEELDKIFSITGFDKYTALKHPTRQYSFNLTHPKNIPEKILRENGDRGRHWGYLSAGEDNFKSVWNLTTEDFTERSPLIMQNYLGETINAVEAYHNKHNSNLGKITRIHCAYLAHGAGYQLHVDSHTTIRYHLPIATNHMCYMMTANGEEIQTCHLPADGRIWLLNTSVLHTALNLAPNRFDDNYKLRCHVIFSVTK